MIPLTQRPGWARLESDELRHPLLPEIERHQPNSDVVTGGCGAGESRKKSLRSPGRRVNFFVVEI